MFPVILRKLMETYYETNGIIPSDELKQLENSAFEYTSGSFGPETFTVSLTSHLETDDESSSKRLLVLHDMKMQAEQPYLFWVIESHAETCSSRINWSTLSLLLCLVKVQIVDVVTFAVALGELCILEGMQTIKNIVSISLGSSARPFLAIYEYAPELFSILIGIKEHYRDLFVDSSTILEKLYVDSCAYTVYNRSISGSSKADNYTRMNTFRPITIRDILQLLLLFWKMHGPSTLTSHPCEFPLIRQSVQRINTSIDDRLIYTRAFITLFVSCGSQAGLLELVQNRGSLFLEIGPIVCGHLVQQKEVPRNASNVAKLLLETFYNQDYLSQHSKVLVDMLTHSRKRFQLAHVVTAYLEDSVYPSFGKICFELLQLYGTGSTKLYTHLTLCLERNLGTSPLAAISCYMTVCMHATRHIWSVIKADISSTDTPTLGDNTISLKHVLMHAFKLGGIQLMILNEITQELTPDEEFYISLQKDIEAWLQFLEVLLDIFETFKKNLHTESTELRMLFINSSILQTVLSILQSLYVFHSITRDTDTPEDCIDCVSQKGISLARNLDEPLFLISDILFTIFDLHFNLCNKEDSLSSDLTKIHLRNALLSQCFSFLFSLACALSAKFSFDENDMCFSILADKNKRELLRSFNPTTSCASEALAFSIFPCAAALIMNKNSAYDDFLTTYCKNLVTLCTTSAIAQSNYKLLYRIADNCQLFAALNLPKNFQRHAETVVFFQRCLISVCGETALVSFIGKYCIEGLRGGIEHVLQPSLYDYIPWLTLRVYLPMVRTVPEKDLAMFHITEKLPVLTVYPSMSADIFGMVTEALLILTQTQEDVQSVLACCSGISKLTPPSTYQHNALVLAVLCLVILTSEGDTLEKATTVKKFDALIASLDAIKALKLVVSGSNLYPNKLLHECINGNNRSFYLEGLFSILFILMTASFPLTKEVLSRVQIFYAHTASGRKTTTDSTPIKIFASLPSQSGELFKLLAMESMKPFLKNVCYREAYLKESQSIPSVCLVWNKLKEIYLSILVHGIRTIAILELVLDYFGVFFYIVSTSVPNFLYISLSVECFLSLENILPEFSLNKAIFQIYWLAYVRMLLESSSGVMDRLTVLLIDGLTMPDEIKDVVRLLISLYRKPEEFRATQLYSSVEISSQTARDSSTILVLLELLADATDIQCEFLWRVLLPLVLHILSDLFALWYTPLLLSLLPETFNLFSQDAPVFARSRTEVLVKILTFIKAHQDRLENSQLKGLTTQVLSRYETLLENQSSRRAELDLLNFTRRERSKTTTASKSKEKHSTGYFDDLVEYLIESSDFYGVSCITRLMEHFSSFESTQRSDFLSPKTYQRISNFVNKLSIVMKDAEEKHLLYTSLSIANFSSFLAVFIGLLLDLLKEGVMQRSTTFSPRMLQYLDNVKNLWSIIVPYTAVIPALGELFYHGLMLLYGQDKEIQDFVHKITKFLAFSCAALITRHYQLVNLIESHMISSLYISSTDALYEKATDSSKLESTCAEESIRELEDVELCMRDVLIQDICQLRQLVSGDGFLSMPTMHPYPLSTETIIRLRALSIAGNIVELDRICKFLIEAHFHEYFEDTSVRFAFKHTLLMDLSPESSKTLYISRLDPSFNDEAAITQNIPKAALKVNANYTDLLKKYPEFTGSPLRLIVVAGVYWVPQTSPYTEIFLDILQYISQSYAVNFSIYFLNTFRSDVFFSIISLLAEGSLSLTNLSLREGRPMANTLSTICVTIITKIISGASSQEKLIYNQDISDTSSNSQLLDRFYGVGYALLGSLYAASSGYPLDDAFSIPQWTLSRRDKGLFPTDTESSKYKSMITMSHLISTYRNRVLEMAHWMDLTTLLKEQEFFDQMLHALDQLPSYTHTYLTIQLRSQKAILFQHNCQFIYRRILVLACARYRECRYTDLTVRLMVHEFIDTNLFEFIEDTQVLIIDLLFSELVLDIDSIEDQDSAIVSMGIRCNAIASMYTALSTYSFLLAIIHRLLFKRPSEFGNMTSKADCWSRFYQKCLVTALSAWMLIVCTITKLLAQNSQKLMDENTLNSYNSGDNGTSRSSLSSGNNVSFFFITNSMLYFAPITDFCLYATKHQNIVKTILTMVEDLANFGQDSTEDNRRKKIQGVGSHMATFLLALGLDTLVVETIEKLTDIIEGSPAILLYNQVGNVCSMVLRICETKANIIAMEYAVMPAKQVESHILSVVARKLLPYPAHFDIAIRQYGVHMLNNRKLDEDALRQPVFNSLIKKIFSTLEIHDIYSPAYIRYISFSVTMTNILKYLQQEYRKKTVNTAKQDLSHYIEPESFFLLPTLKAISSLREFEHAISSDKQSPHKIDSNTECISVLEHYFDYYNTRYAPRFLSMVRHFSSKRAPLLFKLSMDKDENETKLILKCGEDTVADYAVMQFVEDLKRCGTDIFFKPYFVAVLLNIPRNQVSIIEHIEGNVIPLDDILSPIFMGAKVKAAEFINDQEPDAFGCFPTFDLFTTSIAALSHVQMVLFGAHPCSFIFSSRENQKRFAITLAHWCAICIVTGLGDRHSCNILVDTDTGEVHFIDFEAVFEYPKLLSYAELVPFRLTTLLAQLLGPTGIHGRFYWQIVDMVSLIQENAALFINIFYPLAILRNSLRYVQEIKVMLETQTAEEIVNTALAQAADSTRLGCMFGGWMAFL